MASTGILAVWNNCAPDHEAAYEDWYQTEHLIERLGVPGFQRGRRYEAIEGAKKFFTYYETESPDILRSPAYLERLNDPTPFTQRIMSGTFTDMSRTVCRRVACRGGMRGACALTFTSGQPMPESILEDCLDLAADSTLVARAEIWAAAEDEHGDPSVEEKLRGGDAKIASCLFVETLREDAGRDLKARLSERLADTPMQAGLYRLMCELTAE